MSLPAFPSPLSGHGQPLYAAGLSKRELVAALVLAGSMSGSGFEGVTPDHACECCVAWADKLLAALDRVPEPPDPDDRR